MNAAGGLLPSPLQPHAKTRAVRIVCAMDMVYLYGPPAVGKWTVANELVARTGYRLFHNHLSIDCVSSVFDFGTEPFWRQVHAIRDGIIAEAAHAGRDLVFTNVYEREESDPRTLHRFEAVEGNGGRVCLVRLTCPQDVLEQRVVAPHRVDMRKLASVQGLRKSLGEHDIVSAIPGRASLTLDTSQLDVVATASRIIEHYGLTVMG
jgi:hypothetical protein